MIERSPMGLLCAWIDGTFALSQQMISKHIAYLVRARIVSKTKRGRESCARLGQMR